MHQSSRAHQVPPVRVAPIARRAAHNATGRTPAALALGAGLALSVLGSIAPMAHAQEDPAPMLQWFETRWTDIERRMPDFFVAGYGSTWLPPSGRGFQDPRSSTPSLTAGYDPFDRFDLGTSQRPTTYGTESSFGSMVQEFKLAAAEVYIDMVLNHNAGRQTSLLFQQDGGYPGFWMGPVEGPFKSSTANWGDFHNGVAGGFLQSENPSAPRYCLLQGDLVALVDINQATNNLFIRQPVAAGNPLNIPGGTFFNRPNPGNARFYWDSALGTQVVTNPGMNVTNAGVLSSGIFAPPCTVPARNEGPSQLTLGRFNTTDAMAGDPVPENATAYMMRWVQWMLDVQKVDGFRIDAVKHTPSWFFDSFYDTVVRNRRQTPDGRFVTPYSFGESVEGNDFTFDRYIRMPNGRGSNGRNVTQDAYGNRDALDLVGAGRIRDIVGPAGLGTWGSPFNASSDFLRQHLDFTDDGFQNGTIGVNHIFSHDNGTAGDGGSAPPNPTLRQQGWFAHAYLALRPGQKKFYHNSRGIPRTFGFWPRQGLPVALGVDPFSTVVEAGTGRTISRPVPAITNLIGLANMLGRGEFLQRWQDDDVFIFERRSNVGGGVLSTNVVVGCNDSWATGFDERTIPTNFPPGTRLIEQTGNATDATVDPTNQIFDVVTVQPNGNITIRIPRNATSISGTPTDHGRGFVVYAPALPAGTLSIVGATSTLPVDDVSVPSPRRRANPIPVVTSNSFTLRLTTQRGDPAATDNSTADDNAVFRINQGYVDRNGNGIVDFDFNGGVVAGFENFVTTRQPLFGSTNTTGLYEQLIDATTLPEGINYVSVQAFRKRNTNDAPLFRDFRTAFYVDRLPPSFDLTSTTSYPTGTTQFTGLVRANDRTISSLYMILNPSSLSNPPSQATIFTLATQIDRFDYSRTMGGLQPGNNTLLVVAFEETGRWSSQTYTIFVGPTCDSVDFNQDGDFPTPLDLEDFINAVAGNVCATCSSDLDFNNDGDFPTPLDIEAFISVLGGGPCF